MVTLYHGWGATDFYATGPERSSDETARVKFNASQLLKKRGSSLAAKLLGTIPFEIIAGSNRNSDDFEMLSANVPLDQYEELRSIGESAEGQAAFKHIAMTVSEIGPYIRFIVVDLALADIPKQPVQGDGHSLKESEINKVVYRYIGVEGGYLGDFSYRTHREFYIDLDLDIKPDNYPGTTRARFIQILTQSPPDIQSRILEGVLNKYPVGSAGLRTQERYDEISLWISRLRGAAPVKVPAPRITSEVVSKALTDAEHLLRTTGATSGLDRIHTALHGYLRVICNSAAIEVAPDSNLTDLFKVIRDSHPAFKCVGPHQTEVLRVVRAMSTILDSLNFLRNRGSVAHPNDALLYEPEAMLAINSANTILHYIDARLHAHGKLEGRS